MKRLLFLFIICLSLSCTKCYDCYADDVVTGEEVNQEDLCGEDEREDYLDVWDEGDTEATCIPL